MLILSFYKIIIISKTRAVQSILSAWLDPGRAVGTVRPNPEQKVRIIYT